MIISILLSFYLFNLILFSFISNCIYYCILLIVNALLSSYIIYEVLGFSWYSLIFCLIYIGGVYVLFIFVSFFSPNDSGVVIYGLDLVSLVGVFLCWVVSIFIFYNLSEFEMSSYLCSFNEVWLYICFGLMLMFGFIILSLLMSCKNGFYR
uniref:NADH dehydrogenase subunit 6 n=1 Tax=Hydatigera sp. XHPW10 TaxID=2854037 RepID=UPI001F1459B2|nr:NADH dehydrogenase subunit 6 [Hydatigera sp. XHPW10]UKS07996.1 NADH dehydrogenase subunit 6 [Hydatigera sp. XHPW10]